MGLLLGVHCKYTRGVRLAEDLPWAALHGGAWPAGIAGMLATGSIVSNSYIDYGEWDPVVLGQAADNQRSRQTKSYRAWCQGC